MTLIVYKGKSMKSLSADDYVGKWVEVVNDTDCLYIKKGETYFVEGTKKDPFTARTLLKLRNKIYHYDPYRFKTMNRYKNMGDWL